MGAGLVTVHNKIGDGPRTVTYKDRYKETVYKADTSKPRSGPASMWCCFLPLKKICKEN